MLQKSSYVVVGVAVYLFLILVLFGFYHLAVGNESDPNPVWFAIVQTLLSGITNVLPGFVAGWFCRKGGFTVGAVAGAIGGVLGSILLSYLWDSFSLEYRIIVGTIAIGVSAAITNAIGGGAGEFLRSRSRRS